MENVSLINGAFDLFIIILGLTVLTMQILLLVFMGRREISKETKSMSIRFCGVITAMFPMFGILGTVWGLMATLNAIDQLGTGDIKQITSSFAICLSTTLWGIVSAIVNGLANSTLTEHIRE